MLCAGWAVDRGGLRAVVDFLEDSLPAEGPRTYLGPWGAAADGGEVPEELPEADPMPPVLWGRIFVRNRASAQAVPMLLVRRFAGAEWVAVDTKRRLQVVNFAERSKVAPKLWDGPVSGEFRGLTAAASPLRAAERDGAAAPG